ncbi:sperm acrosome membrane-associated protein 6 isoform X5 [Narcine bancroftii]|uniref:sperm acrosome membrane-associated protein 6 isoform X5 n=1 Tax=Narcine bancroftii TaxID=1343680 RepID=UPI003830FE17
MPNSPCLLILFLYLLAVTLTPVLTCYPCFAKSSEKFCTDYVGQSPAEIKTARCWYPIKRLMKERPIYWVRVVAADYKELKSIYSKALKLIKKRRREVPQESYTSLLDHVEQEVLYKVYNLKEATPCNQTCGINKAATYFDCRLCRLHDCNGIRFDCPIEDVRIKETGHVSMKCEASFPIPEISSVTWWFVRSIRSDVIQQFMVLHVGSEDTLTINNVNMRNSGSFACDVTVHGTILLRRFFYLTVTRSTLQSSIDLQAIFQNVLVERQAVLQPPVTQPLLSPNQWLAARTEAQITAAIALATVCLLLAVGGLYRWAT